MFQGTATDKQQVLENGHVYFTFRPKVNRSHISSVDDVQRFHLLMIPSSLQPNQRTTDLHSTGSQSKTRSGAVFKGKQEVAVKSEEQQGAATPIKQESVKKDAEEQRQAARHKEPRAEAAAGQEKEEMYVEPKARLIIIGRKRLPLAGEKGYAFVEDVRENASELFHKHLDEYTYSTSTRGQRRVESGRIVAEARYELISTKDERTHLIYKLEMPKEISEVQRQFGIEPEGAITLQMKNPELPTDVSGRRIGLGPRQKCDLPEELHCQWFKGRIQEQLRFAPLRTEALNFPYLELLLIGRHADKFESELEELDDMIWSELAAMSEEEVEQQMLKQLDTSQQEHPLSTVEFK